MTKRESMIKDDLLEDFGTVLDDCRTAESLELIAYTLDMARRLCNGYIKEIRRVLGAEIFDKRVKLFPVKE